MQANLRIAFVVFGGMQPNAEPGGFEGEMTPPPDFTPEMYELAFVRNMLLIDRAWTETKKAAQMKFRQPHTDSMMRFIQDQDWLVVSNGFSHKALLPGFVQDWQARHERWPKVQFGYVEYGPAGSGTARLQALFEAARNAGLHYVPLDLDRHFGSETDRADAKQAAAWAQLNLHNWKLPRTGSVESI